MAGVTWQDDNLDLFRSSFGGNASSYYPAAAASNLDEDMITLNTSSSAAAAATRGNATAMEEEEYRDEFTDNKWMLVLPRVTAVISLFAIACVAMEAWKDLEADKNRSNVVRSRRIRRSTTTSKNAVVISRIQLFYQIPLFCWSLAIALGTLPSPSEQDIWAGGGTIATCEAQGFLAQFGLFGVIGWDSVLSTTYLLMVRYKVANPRLQSLERYYHFIIWPIALFMSFIPLVNNMYNFNNTICWIETYPEDCVGDECIRGDGAVVWQNLASFMSMVHLFYSITMMICLYCSIRGMENTKHRYTTSQTSNASYEGGPNNTESAVARNSELPGGSWHGSIRSLASGSTTMPSGSRRNSRAVGIQGMLYASGMVVTMAPTASYILLWNAAGIWSDGFAIFATSLLPLVGYVNFCIFMRGRSVESCHTIYAKFLRSAHSCLFDCNLFSCCWCCCIQRRYGLNLSDFAGGGGGGTDPRRGAGDNHGGAAPSPALPKQVEIGVVGGGSPQENGGEPGPTTLSKMTAVTNENVLMVGGTTTESEATTGRGFLLRLKEHGHRLSQMVSELGVSSFASETSTDIFFGIASHHDTPPSLPTRFQSEAERRSSAQSTIQILSKDFKDCQDDQCITCRAEGPPVKPERLESCWTNESSMLFRSRSFGSPPIKPERCISVPTESTELPGVGVWKDEIASSNNPERFLRELGWLPSNPERFLHELGWLDPAETTTKRGPPLKPERYLSRESVPSEHHRPMQLLMTTAPNNNPPVRPVRHLSESEPTIVPQSDSRSGFDTKEQLSRTDEDFHYAVSVGEREPRKPRRRISVDGGYFVEEDDCSRCGYFVSRSSLDSTEESGPRVVELEEANGPEPEQWEMEKYVFNRAGTPHERPAYIEASWEASRAFHDRVPPASLRARSSHGSRSNFQYPSPLTATKEESIDASTS